MLIRSEIPFPVLIFEKNPFADEETAIGQQILSPRMYLFTLFDAVGERKLSTSASIFLLFNFFSPDNDEENEDDEEEEEEDAE